MPLAPICQQGHCAAVVGSGLKQATVAALQGGVDSEGRTGVVREGGQDRHYTIRCSMGKIPEPTPTLRCASLRGHPSQGPKVFQCSAPISTSQPSVCVASRLRLPAGMRKLGARRCIKLMPRRDTLHCHGSVAASGMHRVARDHCRMATLVWERVCVCVCCHSIGGGASCCCW